VLVLTMVADDDAVFAAVQAGALGYVLKGAGQAEISRALAAVAEGQAVYGAQVAQRLRAFFTAGAGVVARPFPELSDREREVLDLMAAGLPKRRRRPPAVPVGEDGAQPRDVGLRQARGARPRRGGGPGA
jgi:DNA-binding NarL/FixJ family response regulator